jgi:6-phosphofructokinase 1
MRFGTYTGGGPAPGLNSAIWAVIQEAKKNDVELFGFCKGAEGILERKYVNLSEQSEKLIYLKGGTFLGTSRKNPEKEKDEFKQALKDLEVDGLITIGGDDTAKAGWTYQSVGVPTNHVPKTIDNDVLGTDKTFGYETVVTLGREDVNALAEDARSTSGIYVSEVMGRGAGHITFGMFEGSAADVAMIPEENFDINILVEYLQDKDHAVVLTAEGAYDEKLTEQYTSEREKMRDALMEQGMPEDLIKKHFPVPERDPFGNVKKGGIAQVIVAELKKKLPGRRIRQTPDLGYQYRCADPIPADIQLAQRMARFAFTKLLEGIKGTPEEGKNVGIMAALQGTDIGPFPLENVVDENRLVPEELYKPYLTEGGLLIHY